MNKKSYEEMLKEKEYRDIAEIFYKHPTTLKDNRVLFKAYYREIWGLNLDEAFSNNRVPNYQTIERKARLLKATNKDFQVDKSEQVTNYKEIAREIPVAVRIF